MKSDSEIKEFIDSRDINLSDTQIANKLIKLKQFKHYRIDSLRRRISEIRTQLNIRQKKPDTLKLIQGIIKKYPEYNSHQQATKLQLKTGFALSTCRKYLINYKNYGNI